MKTYGVIGTGTIGEMLIQGLIKERITKPTQIIISDKDQKKLKKVAKKTGTSPKTNKETISHSDILFLCVKPQDLTQVYPQLRGNLKGKIVISCVAAVESKRYYKELGKIRLVRIIPSITNRIRGIILLSFGDNLKKEEQKEVKSILSKIAKIYEVKENELDNYTHLSSCFPAILSEFIREYLEYEIKNGIDSKKGRDIILDTVCDTGELLKKYNFKIIKEVCTGKGISQEGVKFIEEKFPIKELVDKLSSRMKNIKK
ncbi:MAG: NAD(P)-binding domain-containing protein [Candidatus Nanoarchaeia archaeon]|nr:NAD(P)-binding domain-containing protein [Candidatus Nanoarchaeia archaeon]